MTTLAPLGAPGDDLAGGLPPANVAEPTPASWQPSVRTRTLGSLAVTLFVATLPYREILLGRRTALYGDVIDDHLPMYIEVWREIGRGHWPWWTPRMFAGHNMVGAGQFAVFYPFNVMYGILEPTNAHRWWLLLHVWIGAAGAFAWSLHRWKSRPGAIVSGFGYALSGFAVLHLVHTPYIASVAWLPLIFLGVDMVYDRWTSSRAGLVAIPLALCAFAGHPQMLWIALVGTGTFTLVRWIHAPARGPLLRVGGALAAGLGLGALQSLPLWSFSRTSVRPHLDMATAFESSAEPRHLLVNLFPYLFGGSSPGPLLSSAWLAGPTSLHELGAYVGITAFMLAIAALVYLHRDPVVRALVAVTVVATLFSLTSHTPFGPFIFHYVPLARSFRDWPRMLMLADLAIPMLAGAGVREIARAPRRALRPLVGAATVLLGVAVLAPHISSVRAVMAHDSYGAARLVPIALAFAFATVAAVAVFVSFPRAGTCLLIAVCAFDFVTFASQAPWHSEGLRPNAGAAFFEEDEPVFGAPYDAPGGIDRWASDTYGFRLTALVKDDYGLNGYDPLLQRDFADTAGGWLYDGYPTRPDLWQPGALADVLRVSTLILNNDVTPTDPTWQREGDVPGWAFVRWTRAPRLPEAYLVGEVQTTTLAEMPAKLADQRIDFADTAFVEAPFTGSDALDRPGRAGTVGDVDVLDHGTVTVDATRPALLVISHGWQHGWSATVDGNAAPLVRADGLVLGVPVPAGHHEVKVTFTPPGLRLGAAITVASAVVCFGVVPAVITYRRRRRRTAEAAAGAPCP